MYQSWSVVFGEQPSAAKWNILGTNDASFNDGTGIGNATITASKLSTGAASNTVTASESTGSTSYANLSTTGPAVTVTIGENGLLLVGWSATINGTTSNAAAAMAPEITGTNTVAASDSISIIQRNHADTDQTERWSGTHLYTGLNTGSTTVTAKYRASAGTPTFVNRTLWAVPL